MRYTYDVVAYGDTGLVVPTPPTGCSEATDFLARVSGSPDSTHVTAYTDLICGLVTDGVWPLLDVLQIYATDIEANALLNLVSTSYPATKQNSPTFTADVGWTMAVNNFISTGFNPFAESGGSQFTLNAASIGSWNIDNVSGSISIGTDTNDTNIYPEYVAGTTYIRVNDSTASGSFATASGVGFFLGCRSDATTRSGYRDGASIGAYGSVPVAAALQNNPMLVGPDGVGTIAAAVIGGDLDAVQGALYTRLLTYMQAVGAV